MGGHGGGGGNKGTGVVGFVQDLVLGGTSGVIAKTACAPLERVKILLQVQSSNPQIPPEQRYKGIVDCFTRVSREQGLAAFWRGNFANCLRYFPTQAMNFAFKDKYQQIFVRPREKVGFPLFFAGYLASGAAAGATSLTVSYPLEFAYTRLAADTGKGGSRQFNGIVDCLTKTFKSDGLKGIYRGYAPSVMGIVVYRAGYFGLYDFSLTLLPAMGITKQQAHSPIGIFGKFVVALTVDIFSAMCAYPLDTIRRRLMMQSGRAASEALYTTTLGAFKHISKHEGLQGFYKGAYMNNLRAIGSALVLVIYGELKHHLIDNKK